VYVKTVQNIEFRFDGKFQVCFICLFVHVMSAQKKTRLLHIQSIMLGA